MPVISSSKPKASCAPSKAALAAGATNPQPGTNLGDDPARWPQRGARDFILWIGRSDTFHKQPLLLLELAKRCPDLPFLMIMNRTHVDVFEAMQAQRPANLTIVERVPHQEIWGYYRRARVFVSTSAYEGFPNTFLQCAVTGVPVASLAVDPEGILSRHGCGLLADGNLECWNITYARYGRTRNSLSATRCLSTATPSPTTGSIARSSASSIAAKGHRKPFAQPSATVVATAASPLRAAAGELAMCGIAGIV